MPNGRREPPGHRPDRRRRGGERLAPLHTAAHAVKTAFEHGQHIPQGAKGAVRRGKGGVERRTEDAGRGAATHGSRPHQGGEFFHGADGCRVRGGLGSERVHGGLQGSELGGELRRRLAVAAVFHLQRGVRAAQIGDGRLPAPPGAEPDEHREGKRERNRANGRPERESKAAHHARGAIRQDDGITARSQGPPST